MGIERWLTKCPWDSSEQQKPAATVPETANVAACSKLLATQKHPLHQSLTANVADVANVAATLPESPTDGVLAEWTEGIGKSMDMECPPAVGEKRWHLLLRNAKRFVSRWGVSAAALGWQEADIFGCDSAAPDERVDMQGLAWLIGDGDVIALTAKTATIRCRSGAIQVYRRPVANPSGKMVAAWDLKSEEGR
jgi:hypothetical protein